ncbi:secretory subunit, partial [Coemansia asiatica]
QFVANQGKAVVKQVSPEVYCPYFAGRKESQWWLIFSNYQSGKMVVPPILISDLATERIITLQFQSPPQCRTYRFQLAVKSDSYIGCDIMQDIDMTVVERSNLPQEPPVDDDISEPEADSIAAQMAQMRGQQAGPRRGDNDSSDEEYSATTTSLSSMATEPVVSAEVIRECIQSPQTVIEKLFAEHCERQTENSDADDIEVFGKLVQTHFKRVFRDAKALNQIPVFGRTGMHLKPKPGSLARFRCMVQDPSYGEELHLSVAQLINTETGERRQKFSQYTDSGHKLKEGWEVDYASNGNRFIEKEVAYCVSVPGQSGWAEMDGAEGLEHVMEALDISSASEAPVMGCAEKYSLNGQTHSAALVKFYAPGSAPK